MDRSAATLIVLDAVLLLESSNDDDDREEIDMYATVTSARTGSRVCRIQGYAEDVVPMYRDSDFRRHFRLRRETFEMLLRHLTFLVREATSQSPETTFDYSVDNGYSRNNPFSFRQVWHK